MESDMLHYKRITCRVYSAGTRWKLMYAEWVWLHDMAPPEES